MTFKQMVYGVATFLPGVNKFRAKGTGGTDSARYCYSVWLRHLVMAKQSGLNPYPKVVAELGPGDSLGIGLAALISGCDKYYAFDVVEHANHERNVRILDELIVLFRSRAPIPGQEEFPAVKPYLDNYEFPTDVLSEDRLVIALDESRLKRIRSSISDFKNADTLIEYKVPWCGAAVLERESVDMIYSQAVLEHVDDLEGAYESMHLWLKPDGFISHQIDYRCHGTSNEWNGHWMHSELMWKLIRGKRPYLLNRQPHSAHLIMLAEKGFEIVGEKRVKSESLISRSELAREFKSMAEVDLTTSGAFIQGVKRSCARV